MVRLFPAGALCVGLAVAGPSALSAQIADSAAYRLVAESFAAASGKAKSTTYQLFGCLSQQSMGGGKATSASYIAYAGCAIAIPAGLPSDDDDGDGASNENESAAPGDGDGNGDGIPDGTQGGVASLSAPSGGPPLTIQACQDAGCTFSCQLKNVRALSAVDLPASPRGFFFPFGLLEFTADCSPLFIKIFYHGSDGFRTDVAYLKFGPNPPASANIGYYELPGVSFGAEPVGSDPLVATASFTLIDGQLGDDTGVDGSIVDQGGPAFPLVPAPAPAVGLMGYVIALIALIAISATAIRRRRPAANVE